MELHREDFGLDDLQIFISCNLKVKKLGEFWIAS